VLAAAFVAVAVVAALLGFWAGFWLQHGSGDIAGCLFIDHECSTAAATWMLFVVTTGAFVAAFWAAFKAAEAYSLETLPKFGQSLCDSTEHKPRATRYVEGRKQINDHTFRADDAYFQIEFDFENLGRSALAQISVTLQVFWLDDIDNPDSLKIDIGNIPVDKSAHVLLKIGKGTMLKASDSPFIGWSDAAQVNESEIKFIPFQYLRVERRIDKTSGQERFVLQRVESKQRLRELAAAHQQSTSGQLLA